MLMAEWVLTLGNEAGELLVLLLSSGEVAASGDLVVPVPVLVLVEATSEAVPIVKLVSEMVVVCELHGDETKLVAF